MDSFRRRLSVPVLLAATVLLAVSGPRAYAAQRPGAAMPRAARTGSASYTPAGTDTVDATPSHYYLWRTVTPYSGPRDARGVVMIRLARHSAPVYSSTAVAQWAVHFYENWLLEKEQAELEDFLVQARWLRDSMDSEGGLAQPYAREDRGLEPGWHSAMTQGLAISVLVRAGQVTGDDSYLAAAVLALRPFLVDVAQGGVVTEGGRWLEEYPDGHHVLNGSLFAAFGVYDLLRATGDPDASRVWRTFTANLAENIGRYESNGAILYELHADHYCHTRYFDLHLRQLRSLAQLTGDPVFSATADRWERSFRAYPEPRIRVQQRRGPDGLTRVEGEIDFLYDFYYPPTPSLTVRDVSPLSRRLLAIGGVPVTFDDSGRRGRFSWTPPIAASGGVYSIALPVQPKTPESRYDYRQLPSVTVTVPVPAAACRP